MKISFEISRNRASSANAGKHAKTGLPKKTQTRSIAAAGTGRLMTHWKNLSTIEKELASNWLIRERARDLERNDDYAQRFLLEFRTNVPGPNGFTFQSNVTELKEVKGQWQKVQDVLANNRIEEALADFSLAANCSIDGQRSFSSVQDLAANMWARDGEIFIRMIPNSNAKYGLQLQLIEPEAVDEFYNIELPNGNIVKMGVELDKWRRPVAYYVSRKTKSMEIWGSLFSPSGDHDRIPAEQMLHIFDQRYPNQTRGLSLMVQSMVRLKRLGDYEEAVLNNAVIAASKMGFFSDKDVTMPEENVFGGTVENSGVVTEEGEPSEDGNQAMEVSPGSFEDIGAKQFTPWDPEFPNSQHEMFVKTTTHTISAGFGTDYSSITNDLGDTSYSSARVGLLDVREIWKLRQKLLADRFLIPFYSEWLKYSILSGALNLPMSKFEKFNKPVWVGRRWLWVDPLKDIMAAALEIEYGLGTRTQQLAERGLDINQVDDELATEAANAKTKGVILKFHDKSSAPAMADPNAIDDTDVTPNDKKKSNAGNRQEQDVENRILDQALAILLRRKTNGHGVPALLSTEK